MHRGNKVSPAARVLPSSSPHSHWVLNTAWWLLRHRQVMMEKELKNGRLAMIAFASYLSAHFIPGSVPALGSSFH